MFQKVVFREKCCTLRQRQFQRNDSGIEQIDFTTSHFCNVKLKITSTNTPMQIEKFIKSFAANKTVGKISFPDSCAYSTVIKMFAMAKINYRS